MTDRELLEAAAKAAGYKACLYFEGRDWEYDENKGLLIHTEGDWGTSCEWWSPIEDDGDALRLAIKMDLSLVIFLGATNCGASNSLSDGITEVHGDDPCAATRRAIVRAAAEIGAKQ